MKSLEVETDIILDGRTHGYPGSWSTNREDMYKPWLDAQNARPGTRTFPRPDGTNSSKLGIDFTGQDSIEPVSLSEFSDLLKTREYLLNFEPTQSRHRFIRTESAIENHRRFMTTRVTVEIPTPIARFPERTCTVTTEPLEVLGWADENNLGLTIFKSPNQAGFLTMRPLDRLPYVEPMPDAEFCKAFDNNYQAFIFNGTHGRFIYRSVIYGSSPTSLIRWVY